MLDPGILSGLRQLSEMSGTDLFTSVVGIFRRESAGSMATLQQARPEQARDPDRAAEPGEQDAPDPTCQALHRLRGSAGNIGARRVARACGDLELLAETGHPVGTARLEELAQLLDEALTALDGAALNPTPDPTTLGPTSEGRPPKTRPRRTGPPHPT